MAAPHVAGVVSLIAGLHPEYTGGQLAYAASISTKPLIGVTGKTVTGGLANAYRAVSLDTLPTIQPPANLTAVSQSASAILLTFQGSALAESYVLERSLNLGSGWTKRATLSVSQLSYLDSGLTSGTTYYYRVRALTSYGTSGFSNTASAVTARLRSKGKGR
jgi:hypothetical protein